MRKLLEDLRAAGYIVGQRDESLHLAWTRDEDPDPAKVDPLLQELVKRKAEANEFLTGALSPGRDVELIRHLIKTRGWATIRSPVLGGEIVLLVQNQFTEVPKRWCEQVRYTDAELKALAADPVSADDLRGIHEAKRAFEGTIILEDGVDSTEVTLA